MVIPEGSRRPVAMLAHSYYEEDPRVRREAEALVQHGREVDVFALRRPGDPPSGEVAGVRVYRIDVQRHQGAGLAVYLLEYLSFLVRAGVSVTRAHRRRHYGLVQVHTLPDFLVLAALPLRLGGVPVLLDLHEAMAEFFGTRFPRNSRPLLMRMLRAQERASIMAATHVITVNDALCERLVGLGIPRAKIDVVPNSPSLARFDPTLQPRRAFMSDGTLRLVYAGAVTPIYELDVVVAAIAELRARRPSLPVTLDIYGRGDAESAVRALATELGLGDVVRVHGRIPMEDIPGRIAAADLGLAPTRLDAYTLLSLSTKIFEYAAMKKPVVATRLPLVERTFGPGTIATYTSSDPVDLARVIAGMVDDPAGRERQVAQARSVVESLSWERASVRFVEIVDRLAADTRNRIA